MVRGSVVGVFAFASNDEGKDVTVYYSLSGSSLRTHTQEDEKYGVEGYPPANNTFWCHIFTKSRGTWSFCLKKKKKKKRKKTGGSEKYGGEGYSQAKKSQTVASSSSEQD